MHDHTFVPLGSFHEDFVCTKCGIAALDAVNVPGREDCPYATSSIPAVPLRRTPLIVRAVLRLLRRLS